jgi:hypothetical protein
VDTDLVNTLLAAGSLPQNVVGEHLTEASRLIAKRYFTLITSDELAGKAVQIIIEANQTGNPGDGKIFVCPILEAYRVRTVSTLMKFSKEATAMSTERERLLDKYSARVYKNRKDHVTQLEFGDTAAP